MRRWTILALLGGCVPTHPSPETAGRSRWMEVEVPPAPESLENLLEMGESLYGWNCLPCHGPEGQGDGPVAIRLGLRPRDFTRGTFQLKTSGPDELPFDDDLYRTIATGIPMSGMPAVAEFTPEDRWALVAAVKSRIRKDLPPPQHRRIPLRLRGDAARGAGLYQAGCLPCHGAEGRGGTGVEFPTPDLTRGEVAFKAGSRAEDVARVLETGLAGTPMPAFPGFTERDRADLAAFVVSLYRPVEPGERLYLELGCVRCHTIGRGKHLGPDLEGVTLRRPREWLRAWLRDPSWLIATDAEARRLYEAYGSAMPSFHLADDQIDAILEFLASDKTKGAGRK